MNYDGTSRRDRVELLRDDAVRANRKRNDNVAINRIVFMFLNVFEIFGSGFASRDTGSKEYRVERNLFAFALRFRGRFHQRRK